MDAAGIRKRFDAADVWKGFEADGEAKENAIVVRGDRGVGSGNGGK